MATTSDNLELTLDAMIADTDIGSAEAGIYTNDDRTVETPDVETESRLCKMQERIDKINKFITKIGKYAEFIQSVDLNRIFNQSVNNASRRIASKTAERRKRCRIKMELLSLKIKRAGLYAKLQIVKIKRNLLMLAAEGKIAPVLQAMFSTLVMMIQAVLKIIAVVLGVISALLKAIPKLFTVDPEGIAFFLTPKSMRPVKTKILNLNQSCVRVIPTPVIKAIDTVLDLPVVAMGKLKSVKMASSVKKGMSAAKSALNDVNTAKPMVDWDSPTFVYDTREKILKAINIALALLPLVEPLPKYERLPIWKNLGFFLWLATGWNLAGKQCFGLMGQP